MTAATRKHWALDVECWNVGCSSLHRVENLEQSPQQRGIRPAESCLAVTERAFRSRMGFNEQTIGARRERGAGQHRRKLALSA